MSNGSGLSPEFKAPDEGGYVEHVLNALFDLLVKINPHIYIPMLNIERRADYVWAVDFVISIRPKEVENEQT